MTDTTVAPASNADRHLAMVNYGLLIASVFFAGVPGLIAVVIAYAQRDRGDATVRSHFNFQVRIFWIAFALALVAGVCGFAAVLMGIGELFEAGVDSWDAWGGFEADMSDITVSAGLVISLVASFALWILAAIWLLAAPAFGLIRLASERRIGQQAA